MPSLLLMLNLYRYFYYSPVPMLEFNCIVKVIEVDVEFHSSDAICGVYVLCHNLLVVEKST